VHSYWIAGFVGAKPLHIMSLGKKTQTFSLAQNSDILDESPSSRFIYSLQRRLIEAKLLSVGFFLTPIKESMDPGAVGAENPCHVSCVQPRPLIMPDSLEKGKPPALFLFKDGSLHLSP